MAVCVLASSRTLFHNPRNICLCMYAAASCLSSTRAREGVGILPTAAIAVCRCLHFLASRKIAMQSKVRRGSGFQGFPNQLDYGLYFFGCGDECQKYVDCEDNVHFSRDKDTLVYVHGWEVDRVGQLHRETFNWKKNEPRCGLDVDLARAWLENGWNVAVFYWEAWRDLCLCNCFLC